MKGTMQVHGTWQLSESQERGLAHLQPVSLLNCGGETGLDFDFTN